VTRLTGAELLKLRTTRSVYVIAGVALLFAVLTAVIVAVEGGLDEDPGLALAQIVSLSTILVLVVGILLTTNEYRHGTITTTFLVTPRRPRVLVAKLAASAIAAALFSLIVAGVTFGIAVPTLRGTGDEIPVDGQLLEGVGRLVASYTVSVLVGVAIGAIVQNQAGAIVAVFGWIFVAEPIVNVVVGLIVDGDSPLAPYLLGSALGGVIGGDPEVLEAGWALLLSCGYVVVLSLVGAAAMVRRDPA
jgi:ABC-2 type transport system permease protein